MKNYIRKSRQRKASKTGSSLPIGLFSLAVALGLIVNVATSYAGSATWNLNPSSNDWNSPANWTPATVPGPNDTATFGLSNVTDLSISADVVVKNIVFTSEARAYSISVPSPDGLAVLNVSGGITNDSGVTQNFVAAVNANGDATGIAFLGQAGTGTMTSFTARANPVPGKAAAAIDFLGAASPGANTYRCEGGVVSGGAGGLMIFYGKTGAADGTFIIEGGAVAGAAGGKLLFYKSSKADNATLAARGGSNGGEGGVIQFWDSSTGDLAHIRLLGNALLDLTLHDKGSLEIGSLAGNGIVNLDDTALSIGSDNQNTTFAGTIQGESGITKSGSGILRLRGRNLYLGGTTISDGTLLLAGAGSGLGSGPVKVNSGKLSGNGTIAGAVTVGGTGSGSDAFLAPSAGSLHPRTLTLQSNVTFKSDSTYTCTFKARKNQSRSDLLIANGVTIESGAQFNFLGRAIGTLTPGASFTLLSNTAATPISGTFANLADGALLTVGGNKLQASYAGGDGNDLILTVVQ